MALELKDGDNEDLIKKNKKRKPLGTLTLRLTVAPMSKEEMNEANLHIMHLEYIKVNVIMYIILL